MKKLAFLLAGLLLSSGLFAKIKLPSLVGDNMVLQQATQVRLWGEAEPNTTLTARNSWAATEQQATVGSDGHWEIWMPTPSASFKSHEITLENEGERVVLHDVLIGEVWVGSGQSNMEMPLRGFWNCPIEGGNRAIATSGNYRNAIRFATLQRVGALTPQAYPHGGEWQRCEPTHAPNFGATAYFFATLLTEVLQVPVGIINCSWGGSTVEGWLPKEILQGYPDVDLSLAGNDKKIHPMLQPMIMYNGLLKPITPYTIKGFIWYQGESNVGRPDYAQRLATMVAHWRSLWGLGELPFYLVEIAPYRYGDQQQGAALREQQYKASQLIANSGLVCTNDLVEPFEERQIHPKDKRNVGERLAFLALNKTYGYSTIACEGPVYERMEIKGAEIVLHFRHAEEGFNRDNGIVGFEIAGKDLRYRPAKVRVDLNAKTIHLTAPGIKHPVAARYGFDDFLIGNLKNVQGLPVVPFRTQP